MGNGSFRRLAEKEGIAEEAEYWGRFMGGVRGRRFSSRAPPSVLVCATAMIRRRTANVASEFLPTERRLRFGAAGNGAEDGVERSVQALCEVGGEKA